MDSLFIFCRSVYAIIIEPDERSYQSELLYYNLIKVTKHTKINDLTRFQRPT